MSRRDEVQLERVRLDLPTDCDGCGWEIDRGDVALIATDTTNGWGFGVYCCRACVPKAYQPTTRRAEG